MDVKTKYFSSPQEFFSYAEGAMEEVQRMGMGGIAKCHIGNVFGCGDHFHGSVPKMCEALRTHDVKECVDRLSAQLGKLEAAEFSEAKWQFRPRLEEGDDLDVDRWLDGETTCWGGMVRSERPVRVLRLYVNVGGNCDRSEDELAIPGAVAVAMSKALESAGVKTEIWGASATTNTGREPNMSVRYLWRIKASDEYADYGVINFLSGCGKMYRSVCFATMIRMCGEAGCRDVASSLGHHANVSEADILDDSERGDGAAIVVPPLYEVNQAVDWLKRNFAKAMKAVA